MSADTEIANRVRRLEAARQARSLHISIADTEAEQVYHDLWIEYWSFASALDWILGKDVEE